MGIAKKKSRHSLFMRLSAVAVAFFLFFLSFSPLVVEAGVFPYSVSDISFDNSVRVTSGQSTSGTWDKSSLVSFAGSYGGLQASHRYAIYTNFASSFSTSQTGYVNGRYTYNFYLLVNGVKYYYGTSNWDYVTVEGVQSDNFSIGVEIYYSVACDQDSTIECRVSGTDMIEWSSPLHVIQVSGTYTDTSNASSSTSTTDRFSSTVTIPQYSPSGTGRINLSTAGQLKVDSYAYSVNVTLSDISFNIVDLGLIDNVTDAIQQQTTTLNSSIVNQTSAVNNQTTTITTQTNTIMNGFQNDGMGTSSSQLDSSLGSYDELQGNLFGSANSYLEGYNPSSFLSFAPAVISAISFAGSFMNSFITMSGGWNTVLNVLYTIIFVSIAVGLWRFAGKRGS